MDQEREDYAEGGPQSSMSRWGWTLLIVIGIIVVAFAAVIAYAIVTNPFNDIKD